VAKPHKSTVEADQDKALELLLCCLNENFAGKSSIGPIIKKVRIEFESQPDVTQSNKLPEANKVLAARSVEPPEQFCVAYDPEHHRYRYVDC
jgi:hypothetical protein